MGYTTDFYGTFKFNKPVTEELKTYINKFSETRRMTRDNETIKLLYPNWKDLCFNGNLGINGAYFIGGEGFCGQNHDASILDYNFPGNQPGLWCQWIINDEGELEWDQNEKFYHYVEWLEYLITHFFEPLGYVLNGDVEYQGEDSDDFGKIVVTNNKIEVIEGKQVYGLEDFSDDELIDELYRRGYHEIH